MMRCRLLVLHVLEHSDKQEIPSVHYSAAATLIAVVTQSNVAVGSWYKILIEAFGHGLVQKKGLTRHWVIEALVRWGHNK